MTKYNFKEFFRTTIIHNDEWVTNGHFLIKKSLLTGSQLKFIEEHPKNIDKINQIFRTVTTAKELFEESKEHQEFVPELIMEVEQQYHNSYNAIYNSNIELAVKEEYYDYFIARGCKIYKGNGSLNPALLYRDNEFIGILLPVKVDIKLKMSAKDYNDYLSQLKQEQDAKDELKKLNKKCLYISNNKAVIRNKPLKSVAEITGNKKYTNLWIDVVPDKFNDVSVYIDFGIVFMEIMTTDINTITDEPERRFGDGFNQVTLSWYKNQLNKRIENNDWINVAEIKLMELAGEPKEYIEKLLQHRKHITELREKEEKEKELRRQQEEQEFVDSQNKIANDIITQAEQAILKGEKVVNKDITLYESNYEHTTTRLILYLMKLYDIKIPLKTQGWINKALFSIFKNEDQDYYTYNYYNSSKDSTVFTKYLDQLVDKIKTKYKEVA